MPSSGCHILAPEPVGSNDGGSECSYPNPAPERTEEELRELIVGRWEWRCSRIVDRGVQSPDDVTYADSVEYTMQRDFRPDGRVLYYRDGLLESEHTYEVRKMKLLPGDEEAVEMLYVDGAGMHLYASSDTLMYGTGASDGIDLQFVRIE